jgi:hypothetical protein
MRYSQVATPTSHPYTATLHIDPVRWQRLEHIIDEGKEFRLIRLNNSEPDIWTVLIGCASQAIADRMEDGWN